MKSKSVIFALGICLLLLGGCVASAGPGYGYDGGYYPPAQPYYGYGYGRPYYAPRPPVIVGRPYYRQPYRSNGGYRGDGGYRGGPRGSGNPGGGYHGGGGGNHGGGHGRSH